MDNKNSVKEVEKETKQPASPKWFKGGSAVVLTKEKLTIVFSMVALGLLLFGTVLLIAFCGKDNLISHNHDYNLKLELVDGEFRISGTCTAENCDSPEYTEANVTDTTIIETVSPTCSANGKVTYSVERFGKTITYSSSTNKINHSLNGVDVATLMNENGALMYGTANVVTAPGIVVNECNITVDGHYTCSSCENIITAKIFVPHVAADTWQMLPENEPTCTESGKEELCCKFCKIIMDERTVDKRGHNLKYTLTTEDGESFSLTSSCNNFGCKLKDSKDVTANVVFAGETEASCSEPGKLIYTYSNDGIFAETFVATEASTGNHILNGEVYTHFLDKDGLIPYDTDGISFSAFGSKHCGQQMDCHFVCEEENCRALVQLKTKMPDHSYEIIQIYKPSLIQDGLAEIKCSNPWCKNAVEEVILPKVEIGKNASIIPTDTTEDTLKVLYIYITKFGYEVALELTF